METHIIDSNKVWRARQKLRKNVRKDEEFLQNDVSAIFFDGRKNLTLFKEKVDEIRLLECHLETSIALVYMQFTCK